MTVFRVNERVQEIASPHRKGTVRLILRSGVNATIWVQLDSWYRVSFRPAQLKLL
jgi:hypothetical protein